MKANRATTRMVLGQSVFGIALLATLASCVAPPPQPARLPPAPIARPVRAVSVPVLGWRDAAITPGTWRWQQEGGTSIARFGVSPTDSLIALRCDRSARVVTIVRAGSAGGTVTMTLSTTTTTRPLVADARPSGITATLSQGDSLLDAIAFSRGRFAVEVQGLAPLYLPSWPELSRVIEDCRPG